MTSAEAVAYEGNGSDVNDVPEAAEAADTAGAVATSSVLAELGCLEGSVALSALK